MKGDCTPRTTCILSSYRSMCYLKMYFRLLLQGNKPLLSARGTTYYNGPLRKQCTKIVEWVLLTTTHHITVGVSSQLLPTAFGVYWYTGGHPDPNFKTPTLILALPLSRSQSLILTFLSLKDPEKVLKQEYKTGTRISRATMEVYCELYSASLEQ